MLRSINTMKLAAESAGYVLAQCIMSLSASKEEWSQLLPVGLSCYMLSGTGGSSGYSAFKTLISSSRGKVPSNISTKTVSDSRQEPKICCRDSEERK